MCARARVLFSRVETASDDRLSQAIYGVLIIVLALSVPLTRCVMGLKRLFNRNEEVKERKEIVLDHPGVSAAWH